MVEYGSEEALFDASGVVDLSNKVIMVDTGVLELRDGMTYNFDDSIIMQTGYETIYNLGQWYSEEPYGTVIEMDGGSVNVLTPESRLDNLLVCQSVESCGLQTLLLDSLSIMYNSMVLHPYLHTTVIMSKEPEIGLDTPIMKFLSSH